MQRAGEMEVLRSELAEAREYLINSRIAGVSTFLSADRKVCLASWQCLPPWRRAYSPLISKNLSSCPIDSNRSRSDGPLTRRVLLSPPSMAQVPFVNHDTARQVTLFYRPDGNCGVVPPRLQRAKFLRLNDIRRQVVRRSPPRRAT